MAHFVDSKKWVLILPSTFNPVIFFFWAVRPSGGKIYKALKFPFQNVQFPYSKYVCTVVKPQLAAMFRPSHHLKLNLFSPLVITPTPQSLTSWLPGICYFFFFCLRLSTICHLCFDSFNLVYYFKDSSPFYHVSTFYSSQGWITLHWTTCLILCARLSMELWTVSCFSYGEKCSCEHQGTNICSYPYSEAQA